MVKIQDDIIGIAEGIADMLLKLISAPFRIPIHIVLSGGNTPKLIFKYLTENYGKKLADNRFHFWWGDERCVPPTDDESNYKWANDLWLAPIGIAKEKIHRIRGENDCREEMLLYADEIKKDVSFKNGLPRFDLIILGLGDDGHTASIFPDRMKEMMNSLQICEYVSHPGTKQHRITLTGKVINNARKVVFVVTGETKASMVSNVIAFSNPLFPASHIKPVDGEVIWLLDEEAARLL